MIGHATSRAHRLAALLRSAAPRAGVRIVHSIGDLADRGGRVAARFRVTAVAVALEDPVRTLFERCFVPLDGVEVGVVCGRRFRRTARGK